MRTFEDYLVEVRNEFCEKINEQDWHTELRMIAEHLLQTVGRCKQINKREVTKSSIITFQDALIRVYETEKEGTIRFNLFRDSYKSAIEELKSEL